MRRLQSIARPIPVWSLFALALLGAAFGVPALLATQGWLPPTLGTVTALLREGGSPLFLAVPVVCAAAMGPFTKSSTTMAPWVVRSDLGGVCRAAGILFVALFLGFSITGASALVISATRAPSAVSVPALASITLGLAVWVILGTFTGIVFPRGWNLLVAFVASFAVWVLPAMGGILPLALVWGFDWPRLGDEFTPLTMWFRVVFYGAVIVTLLIAVTRHIRSPIGTGQAMYGLVTSSLLIPCILLAWFAVYRAPAVVQRDLTAVAACSEREDAARESLLEACVHPANRILLADLTDGIASIWPAVPPTGQFAVLERAVAQPLDEVANRHGVIVFDPTRYPNTREGVLNSSISEVARALTGSTACYTTPIPGGTEIPQALVDNAGRAEAAAREIVQRAGYTYVSSGYSSSDSVAVEVSSMTDTEIAEMLAASGLGLETCIWDASGQ